MFAPCPGLARNRAGTTSCRWSSALARKHIAGSPLRRLPVAHGRRGQRCWLAASNLELPARRPLEDRRHVVDPSRKGRLGVVERLEPRRRRLPDRGQQCHLQILHRFRRSERHRIRHSRRRLGRQPPGRSDAGRAGDRPARTRRVRRRTQRRDHPLGRYYAFDRDMERVCRHYAEMGVKGFKVTTSWTATTSR